ALNGECLERIDGVGQIEFAGGLEEGAGLGSRNKNAEGRWRPRGRTHVACVHVDSLQKFVGGAQAKCATGRNNLCRSMSAVTLVRPSKALMLRINHTPAPFLPRSTGDMRREGTGCAGEAGRSAFMLWRHRRILQTAAGVLAERGERMGRQLTLFGSIA